MANLFPVRLGIESGLNSDLAVRVVERVKAGNPKVEIVGDYKKGVTKLVQLPPTPKKSIEKETWIANKRSMVLRNKQKDHKGTNLRFIHVFISVEKAREGYQYALKPELECPYYCEFCYLQATLKENPVPTIFANFQDEGVLVREIKIGLLGMHMYTQVHGIQSNIKRHGKKRLHQLLRVLEKSIPEATLEEAIHEIFTKYKSEIKRNLEDWSLEHFQSIIAHFDKFDFKDIKRKFHFNNGDLNDGMANDHLTDNLKFLVGIFGNEVMKKDGGQLLIRTKSENIENLEDLDPNGNVIYSVTPGTSYFSKGVPNYKARLKAAATLLKRGYLIRVNIDPILKYPDTVKQYKPILEEIREVMDTNAPNFERITLGMLRFSDSNIEKIVRKRHPDLYQHYKNNMVDKYEDEEKSRYERQFRVDTYKALKDYAEEIMPGVTVRLSTEAVSVWKDMGLTWE